MKLAGLTWWRNNYGSILQAYALQKAINEIPNIEYEIINQYGKKIVSVDNLLDKLRTIGLRKTIYRVVWKFGFKNLRRRNKKLQNFVDNKLNISARQYTEKSIYEANKYYDVFICGSDQIWNPNLTELGGMYWLTFVDEKKCKIAYAPSIGIGKLSDQQEKKVKDNLSTFKAVSCREVNGATLISNITGKPCHIVLDPTLMVERKIWDEICTKRKYNEPYIFTYLLRGTKEQRKIIEKFAEIKKLSIITIPFLETDFIEWYDFKFGDIKFWDCAPDEFISLIRNAEYVFTDSFHGTVFSCLYHIPFFIFPKIGKNQMIRLIDLQDALNIKSRLVRVEKDIMRLEDEKIDWCNVDEMLDNKRKFSQRYLKSAILDEILDI